MYLMMMQLQVTTSLGKLFQRLITRSQNEYFLDHSGICMQLF